MAFMYNHFERDGRYRFRQGRSLDPHEEFHPEMRDRNVDVSQDVPNTLDELIAMQQNESSEHGRSEKPERCDKVTYKVKQALALIHQLETSDAEDLEIALTLVRQLEEMHDKVVIEMKEDTEAKHGQIAAWAVDADRLMHSRIFLENIDLE